MIIRNTGLYKKLDDQWVWAKPTAIRANNPGLAKCWSELDKFFTKPDNDKSFQLLIDKLSSSEFGVRGAVIPILMAASLQAFAKAIIIKKKGIYLPDILASDIEALCSSPMDYSLDVIDLNSQKDKYLKDLIEVFGGKHSGNSDDLMRQVFDAVVSWKAIIPEQALRTSKVSKNARAFQKIIRNEQLNPEVLALRQFPEILGSNKLDKPFINDLSALIREIEGIVGRYTSIAIDTAKLMLSITGSASANLLEAASEWARCFEGNKSLNKLEPISKAILARARTANSGRFSEASFARALSEILLQRSFDKWDDPSAQEFSKSLRSVVTDIEQIALSDKNPSASLRPLLEQRIDMLKQVLKQTKKAKKS